MPLERNGVVSGAPARISRETRLRKHADFERVYRGGRRLFSEHLTVFFLARDAGPARVGFTVGRVLGNAVERNRLRRRLREAARLEFRDLGGAPADVVIHPRKSALGAGFAELRQQVANAFGKIGSAVASRPRDGGGQ